MKSKWMVGGMVEVVVEGTPMYGKVISAPFEHDDAWVLPVATQAWVVEFEDFGAYAVSNGVATKALNSAEVRQVVEFRNR
jgi:hypothetical protein